MGIGILLLKATGKENIILTNDTTRKNYDNFLDNSSKDYFGLKNCFKNENFKKYLPNDKQQANIQFHRDSEIMSQRHGTCKEDNRDFNLQFNEKKSKRNNLPNIEKEYFRNTEQFNDSFTYKKKNGQFSTQIIKYNIEDIIPYQNNKNLKFVDIKNFNKLYLEDTVEDNNCTSLNRAFLLQPVMDYEEKNITDYEKQTEELKNNSIDL